MSCVVVQKSTRMGKRLYMSSSYMFIIWLSYQDISSTVSSHSTTGAVVYFVNEQGKTCQLYDICCWQCELPMHHKKLLNDTHLEEKVKQKLTFSKTTYYKNE